MITYLLSWFTNYEDNKQTLCMHLDPSLLLPSEIWYHIVSYLDAKALLSAGILSKPWRTLAQDDLLWKQLCTSKFDTTGVRFTLPISWKQLYSTHKIYNGCWDVSNMGKMILSRDFKSATHGGDFLGSYQCVRGTLPITTGVTYFEVQIDKLSPNQTGFHVVIGVVPANFNYWHTYLTSNGGWGYLADGRKAHNSGNGEMYGMKYVQGERVGVLVDLTKHTVAFYLNGISQGIAFNNVVGPVYPGVSLLTGGQRVLLVSTTSFPSKLHL